MKDTKKKPIGEVNLKKLEAVSLELRKTGEMLNSVRNGIGACQLEWSEGLYFAECLELLDELDKNIISAVSTVQTIINKEVTE